MGGRPIWRSPSTAPIQHSDFNDSSDATLGYSNREEPEQVERFLSHMHGRIILATVRAVALDSGHFPYLWI
jgi:hypothetical protein